ncbi:MAG: hypothetical protein ACLPKE_04355 [Streptosporangiaceae bacterium]
MGEQDLAGPVRDLVTTILAAGGVEGDAGHPARPGPVTALPGR